MNPFTLPPLTLATLKTSATDFAHQLHNTLVQELYGATDGKAVGTYVEQMFRRYLVERYSFTPGNSASGIDFPALNVDIKSTSNRQPQSSSPFRDASQKVYGLGYHLLIFVYDKRDDANEEAAKLNILNVAFVDKEKTGDWQTTKGITDILARSGNIDDIIGFLEDRSLPVDETGRQRLAEQILQKPSKIGYLTISNALQWRLQYSRAISTAVQRTVQGVENLYV